MPPDPGVTLLYADLASLATLSLVPPLVAGRQRWAKLPPARRVFWWCLLFQLVVGALAFALGRLGIPSHFMDRATVPVATGILLLAFAAWQVDAAAATLFETLAPRCILFWIPPMVGWERPDEVSHWLEPVQAILCLAVATYTVVRRAVARLAPAGQEDWFWIGSGVMLYMGAWALTNPMVVYLLPRSESLAFAVLAGASLLGNLLIFHGMRCPTSLPNSGHSCFRPRSSGEFSWWW
jgi:hypothetical protein